jgi:hypothetical protein
MCLTTEELISYNIVIHKKFGKTNVRQNYVEFSLSYVRFGSDRQPRGVQRYPANTKHGCDRSKILMEVLRLNIEALSDGSVVLPTPAFVRQQPDEVRQQLSDSLLEARITEMLTRKTEPLLAEIADIKASQADAIERAGIAEFRTELLGELAA